MRRSLLFLPGNNPNMLINANCLGADAVIFDLEDAVSPSEKDAARILVRNTLKYMDFETCETIVRINSVDTDFWKKDIDVILPCKPFFILLPKVNAAEDVLEVSEYIKKAEEFLNENQIISEIGLLDTISEKIGDFVKENFTLNKINKY